MNQDYLQIPIFGARSGIVWSPRDPVFFRKILLAFSLGQGVNARGLAMGKEVKWVRFLLVAAYTGNQMHGGCLNRAQNKAKKTQKKVAMRTGSV
jgi:hypothetical protein